MTNNFVLMGMKAILDKTVMEDSYIKISDGKITEVGTMSEYQKNEDFKEVRLPSKLFASPGFIDIHIHGLNGSDVMDASSKAIENMTVTLPQEGTTSFLATTITQDPVEIEAALQNVNQYSKTIANGAELLGIHLEGPFISPKRAGAQPVAHIMEPDKDTFMKWQEISGNLIKVVTLAPEERGGIQLVKHLNETGVIASIGHSDALYPVMEEAIQAGATHVTHFYNGMRGIHHREPGVVGAGLAHEELFVELIADGIHVHPAVIKATYHTKGADRIILITDSMRAKWLEDGEYELGGQKVTVSDNTALLEDGTLAGSLLKMNEALRNMKEFTNCSLPELVQMASSNPARQLNVWDRKGSIHVGKDADIVILDEQLNVHLTICKGVVTYRNEVEKEWI
ncbi:N-acetylglucosamine-6-phosphate deacetylase [Bacillus tianshenii]|uniref:N-acetylglucosamine-6-phosphate deacetylase n=1 Tax=Sutcliffiella tianshenii TaxID=1463404 RepID=A0ABS2P5G7_9BACI|nr:N-acetylglucosamine-6-phosphate deacetylase [Bacillus tianshenii]MBM7622129.1 N-acetylglucosamine-6-phosphate deacetylase [Bacillus tianshenii]